ncbi:MAG: NUDIX hydrolase [Candidatus Thermoplasmatota archaeon]|nr:NUDIX hydrolase [Candidatus Thermoplasmatota archaeon]
MEISAGGVVVKDAAHVLLARRAEHWQLPKGLVENGEKTEETAIREVKEETGINARIIKPLGKINYWYHREGKRIYKAVYFFLMEAISGDIKEHDSEMDEVRWFEMDEALEKIAYRNEKDILEKVKKELRGDLIWGNWSS